MGSGSPANRNVLSMTFPHIRVCACISMDDSEWADIRSQTYVNIPMEGLMNEGNGRVDG
jgi:hypothetical protein